MRHVERRRLDLNITMNLEEQQPWDLQLSPAHTCQRCQGLPFTAIKNYHSEKRARVGYREKDLFPTLPRFMQRAKAGCKFCSFIANCIDNYFGKMNRCFKSCNIQVEIDGFRLEIDESVPTTPIPLRLHVQVKGVKGLAKPPEFTVPCSIQPGSCSPFREQDPLSPANVQMFKAWLHECEILHTTCNLNRNIFLPTRVINVMPSDLERGSLRLEHLETTEQIRYAALSYCWGVASTNANTTSLNVEARRSGFQELELPQTLRDAVQVARKLEIPFIWIDSVCIIQDYPQDWQYQSAQMGSVYQNAYVTIIAKAATSSSSGFLQRKQFDRTEIPIRFCRNGNVESMIFRGQFPRPKIRKLENQVRGYRWSERGWTFQEMLLATRSLSFSPSDIVYFECSTSRQFERNGDRDKVPPKHFIPWLPTHGNDATPKEFLESTHYSGRIPHVDWYMLLEDYALRVLTVPEDKLPAISGLAQKMSQVVTDAYLAGLWKKDLWRGLLWGPIPTEHGCPCAGPSWSWITAKRVEWSPFINNYEEIQRIEHYELKDADITLSGSNKMGGVIGGRLVISGRVEPAATIKRAALYHPACFLDSFAYSTADDFENRGVQALALAKKMNSRKTKGLLLQPTGRQSKTAMEYRRVGYFLIDSDFFTATRRTRSQGPATREIEII